MAYSNITTGHKSWFQEQQNLVNNASDLELQSLSDNFDTRVESAISNLHAAHKNLNVMRDAKKLVDNPELMMEYKTELLEPILDEMRGYDCDEAMHVHLESVADQLDKAWDAYKDTFITESYNVATYLPLSTMDFPALVKQYLRFLGKEIMPIQTAASTSIEQRIFIKYLVNNQTGEEYETPAIFFKKDADGKPLWKTLAAAGKGYRIDPSVITLATIASATNKKYSLYNHLLDDAGNAYTLTPTVRNRISYDFGIQYVQITYTPAGGSETTVKVRLPGGGISVDTSTGGIFLNGGITDEMTLTVVDADNKPTGATVTGPGIADKLYGQVDFVKGTIQASSCGIITGIYCTGHVSNETNTRTIGFREYPEIRKFLIGDEARFQLPFTVEDFAEATASLNFNLYNRLVQEIVTASEMFEDESILEFLAEEFEKYDGSDTDVFGLESYTHTEYVDMDPASQVPNFAGDPWEYRTNALHNAINSVIYELCDRGKLDNLGFVIYANPKACRLINKFVTWSVQKSTEIGGVQMNHAFGIMTDTDVPIRVVASNRIDAYTAIPAYQDGAGANDLSKEYFLNIVAYPMDKMHISYKHLRFARHLTNSPQNAAYADAQNPGGAAAIVTTTSQYKTIAIQGIQGRVIFKNTKMVPDSKAGLIA